MITVFLSIDASELKRDIERIERGELELPTVSALLICVDGVGIEDFAVWLQER